MKFILKKTKDQVYKNLIPPHTEVDGPVGQWNCIFHRQCRDSAQLGVLPQYAEKYSLESFNKKRKTPPQKS